MYKKLFIVLISIVILASGCGKKEKVIRLSLILDETSHWYVGAKAFKDKVEENLPDFKVLIFTNASLSNHNQRTELENVQSGVLQASMESTILLSLIDDRFSVFSLPFLFEDITKAKDAVNGKLGTKMLSLLSENKLVGLGYGINGFRQITNSKHSINSKDDLKNLKVRVPPIKMYIDVFKLMGADPSSMNFGELFTALKEGTMDGQENPLTVINSARLYEVQKYLTMWDYSFDPIILCFNINFWNTLSKKEKSVLKKCAKEAMKTQWDYSIQKEKELLKTLADKGMKINYLSASEKTKLKKITSPIYTPYENTLKLLK